MTAAPEGRTSAVSVWRRQIELPRYLRKVRGSTQLASELSSVCGQLGFSRPLLLSGPTVTMELARELAPVLGGAAEPVRVGDNTQAEVDTIAGGDAIGEADVLVAVGGGRTIDVAKAVCEAVDLPVISVPTQLTADGIASPVSVIRSGSGQIESRRARLPIGVVVDLEFVGRSSPERVRAGLGDLLANRSAVLDWRLAEAAGADTADDFAALLAESASELVYGTDVSSLAAGEPSGALLERLLDGLVLSGLAMEIAGSSRPCSGSEHLVSHAIDRLYPGTAQHGEQVAFGSVLCARLQGEDWRQLRQFLLDAGMERSATGLGLGQERILAALGAAPTTRPGRYTVLDELDLDDAALGRLVGELLTPAS